jgi:hypothetical protein
VTWLFFSAYAIISFALRARKNNQAETVFLCGKNSLQNGVCLAPFKINLFYCMVKTIDILGIEIIKVMEQCDLLFSLCGKKTIRQKRCFCVVKTV